MIRTVNELRCPGCSAPRDPDDNFCRRCGRQITVNLPAIRETRLPAPSSSGLPPSVVGSVALLAIGTGIEWLARRLAGNAARAAGNALVRRDRPDTPAPARGLDAVVVREVLYVREVNLRR